ncbi:helix-turn-helix transcriptional regulator [Paenalkalicoccus suaedae]|uniref:Helix-turn-helix transcriptional regulator n=1 Tax=Paenalkalicoccus suaedae TaxID=2592382 RepID=A0A859FDD0_9BACI|nr:helix-turn-helix transcriptional regulator [Paenalkalicoccus suaedae]QKS70216.1 helix-turn-helix transcriptional regulator [Paenalkalicoccus suaedae]
MSRIKNNVKQLRKHHNLSLRELSERVNINYSVISRIESGSRPLSDNEINVFANFFDVSADYILGRSDEPDPLKPQSKDESLFFFDEENLTEEELIELKKHLEFLRYKARQMEEGN